LLVSMHFKADSGSKLAFEGFNLKMTYALEFVESGAAAAE